jgi:hypothetical protein
MDSGPRRMRRTSRWPRFVGSRPRLESLEDRTLLSTITWNTTSYPTGGNWDSAASWNGGAVPGPSDTAKITGLTSPGTIYLDSGNADSVDSLVTDTSTTLEVITGSLSLGPASSSTFGGPVIVVSGGNLAVGAGASVQIAPGETLTDNGTLSFAAADSVTLQSNCCGSGAIAVGGTLTANDMTFTGSSGTMTVNSGGRLVATNSTFNISQLSFNNTSILDSGDLTGNAFNTTLYLPYNDIQFLDGNASFQQININAGTLASGILDLDLIGTNTSNLNYSFPGGFTVASGATAAVGPNVALSIPPSETLTDNGTVTFASGDSVTLQSNCCGSGAITVGGTLTANDMTFTGSSGTMTVNSGGTLTVTNSTFDLSSLTLNYGSTDSISLVQFFGQLNINSGANVGTLTNPSITGNNFSNVGNNGIVASGDPNAQIPLFGNYWGTTVIAQIAAKIDDHNDNANLPTIVYQPFVTGSSGTIATPTSATFMPTDQTISLTATVNTSPGGVAVSGGTETFTILDGTQAIGQTTAPVQVSNGSVTAEYTLPGNTPAGHYVIDASYSGYTNGTVSYLASTDTHHFLTVVSAATVTTAVAASTTFSASSSQTINLSAQVTSTAGSVNEGTVNFTILKGGNPVGSPVVANVVGDSASALYTLLAGTGGGAYVIQAVYSDPLDFGTSTGASSFTVGAAPTTITSSNASTKFSVATGEGISLSANVNSSAGTINEGAVTFTILNSSSTDVVPPIAVNVSSGVASTNYVLPADTPAGSYTIEASFDGTSSFAASSPSDSTLTVSAATTATADSSVSIPYNSAAQPVSLNATVTSPGGIVSDGTVTFTVLSGTTPVGLAVTVSVASGTASASYSLPGGTAIGSYIIQAVYNGTAEFGGSVDSAHSLTVTQAPAYKLVTSTPPSPAATAGSALAVQPVIYEEDQYGTIETIDNSTVITATLSSGAGALLGTATATVVGGIATFTGLGDDTAGTIAIKFSSGDLVVATSGNIEINPGEAAQLVITTQPYLAVTAGQTLTDPVVIDEEDAYGNIVSSDNSTVVTTSLDSGAGTLIGTIQATVINGVASFNDLEDDTAGSLSLQFVATGLPPVISTPSVVAPAAAATIKVVNRPPSGVGAGAVFPVVANAYDPYGNLATSYNSPVTVSLGSGSAGTLSGTTTVTAVNGVATFNDLSDDTSGAISLDVGTTGGSVIGGNSGTLTVTPDEPVKLVIATQPSQTAMAGTAFATQPVIYEEDQFGNIVTTDSTTVVTAFLDSGAGPLKGIVTATLSDGIARFANLADVIAEEITLAFTAGSLTSAASVPIFVSPPPTKLVIATEPSPTAAAGVPFTLEPVVEEEDQAGDLETSDSSTVLTVSLGNGAGALVGTTVTLTNGVATFANLADDTAETVTLKFGSGTLSPAISTAVTVTAAAATQLAVTTAPPTSFLAVQTFGLVVTAEDHYGNVATTYNGDVTLAVAANPGGSALAGTSNVVAVDGVATFSGLTLANTGNGYTLRASGTGLASATTTPFNVSPTQTPPAMPAPTITIESVAKVKLKNSKGKPTGKTALEFSLRYSAAMDQSYAVLHSNYLVESAVVKGNKKTVSYKQVPTVTEAYNTATNTVTLTVSGNPPFTSGGKILIINTGRTGVQSVSGVLLDSTDAVLLISNKAKSIFPG